MDTYTGLDGSVLGDGKSGKVVTLGDREAANSLHFNILLFAGDWAGDRSGLRGGGGGVRDQGPSPLLRGARGRNPGAGGLGRRQTVIGLASDAQFPRHSVRTFGLCLRSDAGFPDWSSDNGYN